MAENSMKPRIRFKGYTDAWEQRKLGTLGETYAGLSDKSKEDFGHGKAEFVPYMNVFMNPIADVAMTEAIEIDDRQAKVKNGDIFFTTSSETPEEVGMSSVWLKNGSNIYLNSFCFGFRPSESINSYYLAYMLRSSGVRQKIVFLAQGISRYNISKKKMMEIEVPMPICAEQRQLGGIFKQLDNLITLHQRKYDKFVNIKKALLEKMFPQGDETTPKIRFKGFTDAWEQRKLGDIGSVAMNRRIFKEQTTPTGEVPFYKIGTFGGVADAFITEQLFEEFKTKYPYPKIGDILVSASGSIGRFVEYRGEKAYFQDSNIIWLEHDDSIDKTFLKAFYAVVKWSGLEGSTIKRLYNKNVLETEIKLPSLKEQRQVGQFFEQLDNLITLHQRQLEKLKNIKSALLEKMFV